MPSALRSIIRDVWTFARRAADVTTSVDTFNEFQLRDIGLTRDNDSIRARAGDIAAPWQHVVDAKPFQAPLAPAPDSASASTQVVNVDAAPRPEATSAARPRTEENKDINISLCG